MKNFTPERRELVEAGWKRADRNNEERWSDPNRPGRLVSFKTARTNYLKAKREDAIDLKVAEERLAEIDADPSLVVRDPDLDVRA